MQRWSFPIHLPGIDPEDVQSTGITARDPDLLHPIALCHRQYVGDDIVLRPAIGSHLQLRLNAFRRFDAEVVFELFETRQSSLPGVSRTIADADGLPGETVTLDGSASTDIDGTISSYEWFRNGNTPLGSGPVLSNVQLPDGDNQITLTVRDNVGNTTSNTITLTIAAAAAPPPTPTLADEDLKPNELSLAKNLDDMCARLSELSSSSPGGLTPEQNDLLARCNGIIFDPNAANQATALAELGGPGNTLAVTAPAESGGSAGVGGPADDSISSSGAAYVFTRTASGWSERSYVKSSNPWTGDEFGVSAALSADGSTLIVGATGEDSAASGLNGRQVDDCGATTETNCASEAGAVYIY